MIVLDYRSSDTDVGIAFLLLLPFRAVFYPSSDVLSPPVWRSRSSIPYLRDSGVLSFMVELFPFGFLWLCVLLITS